MLLLYKWQLPRLSSLIKLGKRFTLYGFKCKTHLAINHSPSPWKLQDEIEAFSYYFKLTHTYFLWTHVSENLMGKGVAKYPYMNELYVVIFIRVLFSTHLIISANKVVQHLSWLSKIYLHSGQKMKLGRGYTLQPYI